MEQNMQLGAKDRILQAAERLFIEKGYKETTSRMIAKEADVNLGLIPYYFEKKENIAINVYSKKMKAIIKLIEYKDLNIDNSIEHFLITYLLLQYHMNQEPGIMKFYLELLKEDTMQYSIEEYTIRSLEMIEKEYNLILGENDIALTLNIIKGAERFFMLGHRDGKLDINDYRINVEIVRCALFYFGVPREIVEQNVGNVEKKLKNIGIDFEVYNHHM